MYFGIHYLFDPANIKHIYNTGVKNTFMVSLRRKNTIIRILSSGGNKT